MIWFNPTQLCVVLEKSLNSPNRSNWKFLVEEAFLKTKMLNGLCKSTVEMVGCLNRNKMQSLCKHKISLQLTNASKLSRVFMNSSLIPLSFLDSFSRALGINSA